MTRRVARLARWALAPVLALVLSGCDSMGYYSQAVSGQLSLLNARRDLAAVIADPATSAELRGQLELVQELKIFASDELSLPVDGQFDSYIQLDRKFVVWNVFVAPELSLEPMTWCFPVAGCSGYRGYFDEQRARRYAERMVGEGYDSWVGGVAAYSTLGWFDDPVLSSWAFRDEARLAELVFHELAHLVLYVPGDTMFNESFATAVAQEGVRRWLATRDDGQVYRDWQEGWLARQRFVELVEEYRKLFVELYASPKSELEKREDKAELFHAMTESYRSAAAADALSVSYHGWFGDDLNNAKLNSVGFYNALVPGFQALLSEVEFDLATFFRRCEELAGLEQAERHRRLRLLRARGNATP